MPSFISSFEEGRVKLSRNLTTETSFSEGKVERPFRDLNRRVSRSNSRFSLDGGQWSDEEERDAEGNNNNNCNGGGGGRRRASAVEILRRNFGDSKSPSVHLSRMQRGAEHEPDEGNVKNGIRTVHGAGCGECKKSELETGGPGTKNEPTLSELTTLDVQGVEYLTVIDQCHHIRDNEGNKLDPDESFSAKEHVYCTVYCIADDSHRTDAEITDRHDDAVVSDATEIDMGREQVLNPSPEPALYSLDDLVDPFGDISHRFYREQAGAESAVQSCRVCLEENTIASLPCCGKAVCDDCLKLYISSQVGGGCMFQQSCSMLCHSSGQESLSSNRTHIYKLLCHSVHVLYLASLRHLGQACVSGKFSRIRPPHLPNTSKNIQITSLDKHSHVN